MTIRFNHAEIQNARDRVYEATQDVIAARIVRLTHFQELIQEFLELEPQLADDTDWHSNDDAFRQHADNIRNGISNEYSN